MHSGLNQEAYLAGTLLELSKLDVITYSASWKFEVEKADKHTLLFFVKTRGQLLMNQEEIPIYGKTLCLLLPGMSAQTMNLSGNEHSLIYQLEFELFRMGEKTDLRKVYDRVLDFPVQGLLQADLLLFQRKIQLLASAYAVSSVREHLRQQYVYELLELILKEQPPVVTTPKDADASIQLTIQYMQDAYATDLNLDTLAELAGMHPAYYSQRFKQKMNKTPIEFLTQIRMNKAKETLLVSAPKIKDLAGLVGYRDEFYFSRRFKENSGCAPKQYTSEQLESIVSLSYPYTDHLTTLGIVPSAAQYHRAAYLPVEAKSLNLPLHAVEAWEIGRQAFLEAKPSLVICKDNVVLKAREHISDIAPIISIPWATLDVFDHLEEIGQLVGRRQAAKEWIQRHEYIAELARKRVQKTFGNPTLTICRMTSKGLRLYGARNVGHIFYRALQFMPPSRLSQAMSLHRAGTNFNWISMTPEELNQYESDYMIILTSSEQAASKLRHQLVTDPAWLRLPAIRQGRYFLLQWDEWMVYAPQAIEQLLEKATQMLISTPLTQSRLQL
ncbi:AraC family transcriptional regulator [Paenibacillus sp. HWE-109]|uniref:AraC family transcriptional regulator n=1 Tax=Paenibacillus sp. HWE-109 TaxID=1306526 RepID=UPI001EDE7AD7|nr:AraC family transcriptional regulator [Paenibacillus sp. HWE-109]UKS24253.1 AraC family transcriptional regulator [Paenibacillus sp. HWE-109]